MLSRKGITKRHEQQEETGETAFISARRIRILSKTQPGNQKCTNHHHNNQEVPPTDAPPISSINTTKNNPGTGDFVKTITFAPPISQTKKLQKLPGWWNW
jgi:hypothetical protein